MDALDLGHKIAKLRKENRSTQEELARYVGVSVQAVSKWECGGNPDIELLPKIADFLMFHWTACLVEFMKNQKALRSISHVQ